MTQTTLESLIIYEEATEGFISRIKGRIDLGKFKKTHGAEIKARTSEIQAMDPKDAAKVALNAAVVYNRDNPNLTIVKKPTTRELDVFYDECIKNPGKINPVKTIKTTIGGYEVLICSRIDKETGKEKFSYLAIVVNTPNGKEDVDIISAASAANIEAFIKYSFKPNYNYSITKESCVQPSDTTDKYTIKIWNRNFDLNVQYDCYTGEDILEEQRDAFNKFSSNKKLLDSSKNAIEQYCLKRNSKEIGSNKIDNIFKYVIPESIFVTRDCRVSIMCKYKFDPEHGIAIVYKNGKLDDIGNQDMVL